jgi:hypothetical protein
MSGINRRPVTDPLKVQTPFSRRALDLKTRKFSTRGTLMRRRARAFVGRRGG